MSIWDTVAAPIIAIINKVVPDKAAAAAAVAQLNQMQLQGQLQDELMQLQSVTTNQSDINKVEAASASMFVAGWRPAIGWVCAAAYAFQFLIRPLLQWGSAFVGHPVTLPGLDDALTQLTYGMLGMGAMRTIEKHPIFNKTASA
jgi:Holin of 3TMs, for gene-transfer release